MSYRIEAPAQISFSGGRTSGYMLRQILDANGGALPAGVHVVFANTGKEREATLRFVHECSTRWAVPVVWLEWRNDERGFEVVGINSASRQGEPFAALIAKKKALPNGTQRFCTSMLKIEPMAAYARSLGYEAGAYREVVGLRYDEGNRLLKMFANNDAYGRQCIAPLASAKVRKADVMAFWKAQPFDLALRPWEGNCDLCFNKGRAIRERIIRDDPGAAAWWHEQEQATGYQFAMRETVAEIVQHVGRTPMLFDDEPSEDFDAECGLHCGVEE